MKLVKFNYLDILDYIILLINLIKNNKFYVKYLIKKYNISLSLM